MVTKDTGETWEEWGLRLHAAMGQVVADLKELDPPMGTPLYHLKMELEVAYDAYEAELALTKAKT